MDLNLSENDIVYGRNIRPLYEDIKSVFVQVSGFLILCHASTATQLEISAQMPVARQRIAAARHHLKTLAPPKSYKDRYTYLVASANGLDWVLEKTISMRCFSDRSTMHSVERSLHHAYGLFKRGSVQELGLCTVDMRCSCCALPDDGHTH